jgi:hypothetical protein
VVEVLRGTAADRTFAAEEAEMLAKQLRHAGVDLDNWMAVSDAQTALRLLRGGLDVLDVIPGTALSPTPRLRDRGREQAQGVRVPPGRSVRVLRTCARGTIDHIVPRARGGTDSPLNLTGACDACGGLKGQWPLLAFLLLRAWAYTTTASSESSA